MPKLRRLRGKDVLTILERFGFELVRITGSHHHMRRIVGEHRQNLNVPIHGSQPLKSGTLQSIYRQAKAYIPEEELRSHFYTD